MTLFFIWGLKQESGIRLKPNEYISSNIKGFLNILEASKKQSIKHLIFASSSSVTAAILNIHMKKNIQVLTL